MNGLDLAVSFIMFITVMTCWARYYRALNASRKESNHG